MEIPPPRSLGAVRSSWKIRQSTERKHRSRSRASVLPGLPCADRAPDGALHDPCFILCSCSLTTFISPTLVSLFCKQDFNGHVIFRRLGLVPSPVAWWRRWWVAASCAVINTGQHSRPCSALSSDPRQWFPGNGSEQSSHLNLFTC